MPAVHDPSTQGGTDVLERVEESSAVDLPWQVMLWNDPINTTDFVTVTLIQVLDIDTAAAERLMLLAHTEGKTAVKHGSKDACQTVAVALGSAGLWATMQKVA